MRMFRFFSIKRTYRNTVMMGNAIKSTGIVVVEHYFAETCIKLFLGCFSNHFLFLSF